MDNIQYSNIIFTAIMITKNINGGLEVESECFDKSNATIRSIIWLNESSFVL